MNSGKKLNILFLAPFCDGKDVGESFNSHRWASKLMDRVNLTVLSLHRKGQIPLAEQLPNARTQTWNEPAFFAQFERFNAIAKPGYVKYYYAVKQWLHEALKNGETFDVIHQMTPAAMRYPSPGIGFNIPLIHGPVQGSLETPEGFKSECNESTAWYMKLRNIDRFRLRNDPWLRKSVQQADLMLVGSRYARELLELAQPKEVAELVHLNIEEIVEHPERKNPEPGNLKLLHVGRTVRTKGLLDSIRALAQLEKDLNVSLDVVGDGDNMSACVAEVKRLKLESKVIFHGKQPRAQVEGFYANCDALLFPSFREPAGGVVLEAMRHGLPVITTNLGGPGYYVNDECGFTVDAVTPAQLSEDIAKAVTKLATEPGLYGKMQQGAYERVKDLGNMDKKLNWLLDQYQRLSKVR
ncbi:MAG: glycosyltransferase family 4 protein [Pseudomonadota bacterium]|nr:glycosyltransferase family 4 protein [Pseudomonadota bacterium]